MKKEELIQIIKDYEFDETECCLCWKEDCERCLAEHLADYLLQKGAIKFRQMKLLDEEIMRCFYNYSKEKQDEILQNCGLQRKEKFVKCPECRFNAKTNCAFGNNCFGVNGYCSRGEHK